MSSLTLNMATAPKRNSLHWKQRDPMSWAALVAWLDLDNPADKKDCGGYVLGELRPTTVRHPGDTEDCTALHRRQAGIVSRSVVALDADRASEFFVLDVTTELACALVIYTTWSHRPDAPRHRVLAPLSRDVTPDEYRLIVQALMVKLGWVQFDSGSSQAERLMYRPSTQGGEYEHHVIDGRPLDADEWLATAKKLGLDVAQKTSTPRDDDSPARPEGAGRHPYAATAIAAELAKLDALTHPWSEGDQWDPTTFAVACNLIEFANSSWSGYSLAEAEADLFDHAPSDEVWGHHDHAARWVSALNRVGSGSRPSPQGSAADDFDAVPDEQEAPAPGSALTRFGLTKLSELLDPDRPPREYVVDPMIATGTSVALVAPAGHRKSLLLLALAVAVARGDAEFAGMAIPRARRVLYVDMENTEDDLIERLQSFGVTSDEGMERFLLASLPNMEPLDSANGGSQFRDVVKECGLEPGDLVVLDSYQRVTEAGENDSDTTRGYYRHTGVHLKALGLTVIRTDNTGKDVSKGARGSSGKRDDVDVEYLLRSDGGYIDIQTGKTRQRGVGELFLSVLTDDDGRTTFHSDRPSPHTSKLNDCVALLDKLGVPDDASQRVSNKALLDAGEKVVRNVTRDAVKVRKKRAAEARRAFPGKGVDDPAP